MHDIRFIKRLDNARSPIQGSAHAAGFDLFAAEIQIDYTNKKMIIDTGLNVSFDPGFALMLFSRSGLSTKHSIHLANHVGVIDADYRGPLKVTLVCEDFEKLLRMVNVGDRIAQAILMPAPLVRWKHVFELDTTERGEGGFGSTGSS